MDKVRILRFNPERDGAPYFQEYEYEPFPGMTVLDVLNGIHANQDPTLSYSHECRNKHCGLCGLMVNGKAELSCKRYAQPDMELRPLAGFPVLRDLTVDRDWYERLRPALRLELERYVPCAEEPERVDMEAFARFRQASRCIECYCCVASCPVFKKQPHSFIGPAALVLEARHHFDPRDDLDRKLIFKDIGLAECIGCGLCSKACRLDVDPAGVIKTIMAECAAGEGE